MYRHHLVSCDLEDDQNRLLPCGCRAEVDGAQARTRGSTDAHEERIDKLNVKSTVRPPEYSRKDERDEDAA